MTFRARPVARRSGRSPRLPSDRRTLYINIGFIGAIGVAVVILVAALGVTWYNAHLAPAAKVGGESITMDQVSTRVAIEAFRLDYAEARVRTMVNLGYLTADQESQQLQYIDNARTQVTSIALERLIDAKIQAKLASEASITVTDADVDAQLQKEATIAEQRHAWVIEIAPDKDPGSLDPTDAQKAAAKAKADKALADLKAGKPWDDVVSSVSTAQYGGQNGDLGFISHDVNYDQAYLDAVFALPVDTISDVIEGADGTYRIGKVTEIGAAQTDSTYQSRLDAAKVKLDDYRAAVRADVIRDRLEAKVVADLSAPAPQRHVAEIYLKDDGTVPSPTAVKTRHILYSPKHDPAGASTLADDDPAWTAAHDLAQAAYNKLKLDISQFDAIARAESDETSAKTTGGKQPYYDENSAIDPAYAAAILNTTLKPGDLLQPIKTSFGWDVIQIMHGPTDDQWATELKKQLDGGAKFSDLARDNSDAPGSTNGGDAGWISRGELAQALEDAIFRTPIGQVSDPVTVSGDGIYIVKVLGEEVRTPTAAQKAIYKSTGFSNWYAPRKAAQNVERLLTTP